MPPRKSQASKRAAAAAVEDDVPDSTANTTATPRTKRQRVADSRKSPKNASTQAAKQKGSTARVSAVTPQEAPEIDEKVTQMVEQLSELYDDSEVLLQQLIPAARDTLETVLRRWNPSSRTKTLSKKEQDFEASFGEYTNEEYIDTELLSQSLLDNQPSLWRPDIILQLANLAKLLKTVAILDPKASSSLEPLESLEAEFPRNVLSSVSRGNVSPNGTGQSALFEETLELAIALRTQTIILHLHTEPENSEIDMESVLQNSFYQESDNSTGLFRGWDVPGFNNANGAFHESVELALHRHLAKLRGVIGGSTQESLEALEEQYPWNEFLNSAFNWAAARRQEIFKDVERQGGIKTLCDRLSDLIRDPTQAGEGAGSNVRDASFKGGSREAYRSLAAMQGETDAQGDEENQPSANGGRSKRKSARGRRLNETQEGRRAVSAISDDDQPEPTPDGGFGNQGRSQRDPDYDPSQETAQAVSTGERSSARSYLEANEKARQVAADFKRNKAPRERRRWTNEEIQRLMDLIAEHGCGWESLKKLDEKTGHILVHRHAVDLKDKARNMKFDYLKAGLSLPSNFDKVLLDSKFRNKLEEMGIDYTQQRMRAPRVIED